MSEKIIAYVGKNNKNGMGVDRAFGSTHELIGFCGNKIGNCTLPRRWRVNSYVGSHMYQIYAWANGKEYTGRGFGENMAVILRETAASKRNSK